MNDDSVKIITGFLLENIEQESATTRKVLAAVPAESSAYKPSEKCMSGLELASHVAAAEEFFLVGVANGKFEWKQPDFKTPAEALAQYEKAIPALIAKIRALPVEKLTEVISFGPFQQPAYTYLALNLKHTIHHRGQLSSYLRPMGGKVPSIYGPSADDKPAASA
jgi:uncharacterized damage-inducible protein DinB